MSKLSRRSFLRFGKSAREPEAAIPKRDLGPLPSVISWLEDLTEEPALPRPAQYAPLFRPPGAVAEADFLSRCTKCGDCASACPHQAIKAAPIVFRCAAGTPMIDAAASPCRLCEDLPCISACQTLALVQEGDPMGLAMIQQLDCLEQSGLVCGVCIEQCPVEGAISQGLKTPRVQHSLCVGCGVCHYACPAPVNAIVMLPNQQRKTPRLPAKDCS